MNKMNDLISFMDILIDEPASIKMSIINRCIRVDSTGKFVDLIGLSLDMINCILEKCDLPKSLLIATLKDTNKFKKIAENEAYFHLGKRGDAYLEGYIDENREMSCVAHGCTFDLLHLIVAMGEHLAEKFNFDYKEYSDCIIENIKK